MEISGHFSIQKENRFSTSEKNKMNGETGKSGK
jgi:hypothetical protein